MNANVNGFKFKGAPTVKPKWIPDECLLAVNLKLWEEYYLMMTCLRQFKRKPRPPSYKLMAGKKFRSRECELKKLGRSSYELAIGMDFSWISTSWEPWLRQFILIMNEPWMCRLLNERRHRQGKWGAGPPTYTTILCNKPKSSRKVNRRTQFRCANC